MCGIGGIRRFGEEPIVRPQVDSLLCALEKRGIDASGIAIAIGNEVFVHKQDRPASFYVTTEGYKQFLSEHLEKAWLVLVHTRWATRGTPRDATNNHPIFSGVSAVVHNGCISNDDELFKDMHLERKGEVDSDILRAIIDKYGMDQKAIRELARVRGSVAAAAVSTAHPGKVLLLRSESPLVLGATKDLLMWASTKEALHLAFRKWELRHGFWMQANRADVVFRPVANNTAILLGPAGQEWHQEFKSAVWVRTDPAYAIRDGYIERQRKWDAATASTSTTAIVEKVIPKQTERITYRGGLLTKTATTEVPDFLMCAKCGQMHELTEFQKTNPVWMYKCRKCDEPFAEKPASQEVNGH